MIGKASGRGPGSRFRGVVVASAGGQKWTDRFHGQVRVAGTNAWPAAVTFRAPRKVIATRNAAVTWARPAR